MVDALNVPWLSHRLGRRRGWLVVNQLLLMGAIIFLGLCDPRADLWRVALGGFLVATASATQDIVIDAFRIDSLDASEQSIGINAYVVAYRVGMLASNAGTLFLAGGLEALGFPLQSAWSTGYFSTAPLALVRLSSPLAPLEPSNPVAA